MGRRKPLIATAACAPGQAASSAAQGDAKPLAVDAKSLDRPWLQQHGKSESSGIARNGTGFSGLTRLRCGIDPLIFRVGAFTDPQRKKYARGAAAPARGVSKLWSFAFSANSAASRS